MKAWIDDIRPIPDESWTLCQNITSAIAFIARYGNEIEAISIDHDISYEVRVGDVYRPFPSPDTFQAVAYFIGEYYKDTEDIPELGFYRPEITIHSSNPAGCEAIHNILKDYGIPSEIKPMGAAFRKK